MTKALKLRLRSKIKERNRKITKGLLITSIALGAIATIIIPISVIADSTEEAQSVVKQIVESEDDTFDYRASSISIVSSPRVAVSITESVTTEEVESITTEEVDRVSTEEETTEPIEVETTSTEAIVEEKAYNYYSIADGNNIATLDYEYQDYLYQMCEKYDMTEHYELMMAQMYAESRFDANTISKTNDYGLMQINICNHGWLSEKLGSSNFLDPYVSIEAGCLMMNAYLHRYPEEQALVAYNMGEGGMRKKGITTSSYSQRVMNYKRAMFVVE